MKSFPFAFLFLSFFTSQGQQLVTNFLRTFVMNLFRFVDIKLDLI